MSELKLEAAQAIVAGALKEGRAKNMKPLGVVVLDSRGALKAAAVEDQVALKRAEIAHGKAYGSLAMGIGSRAVEARAKERPHFLVGLTAVAGGSLIAVPGGALIKDSAGKVIGAVGVSGDTSDNDELAAMAGIKAAGLVGDPGTA
jgi:uncharacterized protein GlcG (DUF336 family)